MNTELADSLNNCLGESRRMKDAARALGPAWPGKALILEFCNAFESDCRLLGENRGFEEATIAFVGPKNAGKGTLTRELITALDKRARILAGGDHRNATRKLTWVSAKRPEEFDPEGEEHVPCHADELEPLGAAYQLLDVPGMDERSESVRKIASRALHNAQIIVFVVQAWQLEGYRLLDDIQPADGCILVPVVTWVTAATMKEDLDRWEEALRATVQPGNILKRIEVADFRDRDSQSEEAILSAARRDLKERLGAAIAKRPIKEIAADRLERRLRQFHREIRDAAEKHLPRTNEQLRELDAHLRGLPARALNDLLGDDRALAVGVRSKFHGLFIDRTPHLFFPWRLGLSVAYWVSGAIDRVPLAIAGSLPSLATVAFNVGRNVRRRLKFSKDAEEGMRQRIPLLFRELAGSHLADLGQAFREDLRLPEAAPVPVHVELRGLEVLQLESKRLFHELFVPNSHAMEQSGADPASSDANPDAAECIRVRTPGAWSAGALGLLGFGIFWGFMAMPLYGLYRDFFGAAGRVLFEHAATLGNFPEGTGSMLCTSLFLALMPMCAVLLLTVSWVTRRTRVDAAVAQIRERHRRLLQKLTRENGIGARGTLAVEFSEMRLDACRQLLEAPQ